MTTYVRLTRYVKRYGIAVDSRRIDGVWYYQVQLGADGPLEWHKEIECDIITEEEFDDYLGGL